MEIRAGLLSPRVKEIASVMGQNRCFKLGWRENNIARKVKY